MDPQNVINSEFERLARDADFSLREYAKYLEIDASTLSKVISGQRGVPKSHATRIADKLLTTISEKEQFVEAVLNYRKSNSSPPKKSEIKLDQNESGDAFFIISQWEYFAILNVLKLKNFNNTIDFLAKSLNISTKRVKQCLDTLARNKFISMDNGEIKRTVKKLNTTNEVLSRALKLAHMEELDIAKSKIEKVDLEKRYYRSNTFTVSKKDIPRLKKIIDKMNAETNKVSDASNPEEVYVLSCQLFPLTNCESIAKSFKGPQHVH